MNAVAVSSAVLFKIPELVGAEREEAGAELMGGDSTASCRDRIGVFQRRASSSARAWFPG